MGGSAALAQIGQINSSIRSLYFFANFFVEFQGPQLTFDGQMIPYFEVERTNNYATFGADISAFAGRTGELRFTVDSSHANSLIDAIRLSTQPIPEASIYSLLACGVLLFGAARATLKRKP